MKKLAIIFLLLGTYSFGQNIPDYNSIIKTLTDSSMAGRGYVESGAYKAADYLRGLFEEIGAKPYQNKSYFQDFNLDVNTFPDKLTVQFDDHQLRPGYDYLLNPMSGSADGTFEVQELHLEDVDSKKEYKKVLSKKSVKGKAFYLNTTSIEDKEMKKAFLNFAYAINKKAPVLLKAEGKLMWGVGRRAFNFPIIKVKKDLLQDIPKKITLNIKNNFKKGYKTQNVIGSIPGKERKDTFIIVCAHYDHLGKMGQALFPGGNDNASGTAGMIEMMKYYAKNPHKYSMLFIAFSGEEAGLVGSQYYVNHPFVALGKTKFVLDLDIMGSADDGITVVNGKIHKKKYQKLKEINEEESYLPSIKARGATQNSDHAAFHEQDVPSFFVYTRGSAKKYHEVEDNMAHLPLKNFMPLVNLLIDFTNGIE